MSPDEQPTILTPPPNGSRPASVGWQAPSVEEMQAKLPQYEVLEILGRGGMGAVYKARQKSLKRLVAIKILPLGLADDEFKFAERFQNEAQTMAAMNHPAIVSVYDFGETADGLLYFIMEFVDGTDVQQTITTSGRLSGEHALAITAHVCDALAYAHARGVIHRDIKPANILINQEGQVKVADFGLAKMNDPAQTSGLTKTGTAMGTPDYVAPEVLSPGMVADHRADIYAVGVMLYQMLTGEVPRGMFKLPSQKGIGSDPRFDEIICKAMEQDREERYQSATEVRQALDVISTVPLPQTAEVNTMKIAKAAPKPRRTWLAVGGIAAVLGLAALFMFGAKTKPDEESVKNEPEAKKVENAAAKPVTAAKGKTLDLLASVDVKRDAIAGEWSRDGGDLLVKAAKSGAAGSPRLQLPYQPPEEYDFEIEFTPESGDNKVMQILSAYQRAFTWQVDVMLSAGMKAGFGQISGKSLTDTTDGTVMRPNFLTNGQRHRSKVEVRKTGLRAFIDAKLLVAWGSKPESYQGLDIHPNDTLRDALHLGIGGYDRAVRFHKITVREITGVGKVDAASAEVIDWMKRDIWLEPWKMENGVLKATRPDSEVRLGVGADATLRLRLRTTGTFEDANTPPLQCTLRSVLRTDTSHRVQYRFQFMPQKGSCSLVCLDKDMRTGVEKVHVLWQAVPFPFTKPEFDVEIRTEGERLSVWSAGKEVASAQDAREMQGACRLIASPGLELTRIETAGLTADTCPADPNANWRDETETVREKLRTKPGYTVGPEGITRAEDSVIGDTPVIEGSVGDRAVRVRYTGQVQISLWFKAGAGSAYVLAQRDRVMCKRTNQTGGDADTLRPSVMHPTGFDATQPHELIVAVQGATLRAWLDGRFITEVEDEAFRDSGLTLVPMKLSTVQKVEVAELSASTPAQWQPLFNKPEDFGGDMKDVELRDGVAFLQGRTVLAPSVSAEGAIRATLRCYHDGTRNASLTIRSNDAARYGDESYGCTSYVTEQGKMAIIQFRDKTAGILEPQRNSFPLAVPLKDGEAFTLELCAEKGQLRVLVNGTHAGTVKDTWTQGGRRFGITPSNSEASEFRDVAMRPGSPP